VNKLLENINNLSNDSTKNIGFGKSTSSKNSRKILLFQELRNQDNQYLEYIDGLIYKDIEFDQLNEINLNDHLNGIIFPDKMIKVDLVESNGFDFVVLHDLNVSSAYLVSEKLTTGFYVEENLDDDTAEILNNISTSFVLINLNNNPKYEKLSGIFDLVKIISKLEKYIFIKLNYLPDPKILSLLHSCGVVAIILDSSVVNESIFKLFDKHLRDIKTDNKNNPLFYPNISESINLVDIDDED